MADEAELARKRSENEIKRSRVRQLVRMPSSGRTWGSRRSSPSGSYGPGATRLRLASWRELRAWLVPSPVSGSGRGVLPSPAKSESPAAPGAERPMS